MMSNQLLWIGINGLAGSGKDTVAKMMQFILEALYNDVNTAWERWQKFVDETEMSYKNCHNLKSVSIAFADQLKKLCSVMFGVPIERFYYNKANSWIAINKDFRYTEVKPLDSMVVTAEEYYTNNDSYRMSSMTYFMSLREVLVYIGTYVCQKAVNQDMWMNLVDKEASKMSSHNTNLEYVICPDVRFWHEFDFIRENKKGINIKVIRDSIEQLDNVAEHGFDDDDDEFDYIIENNGTYRELFEEIWNLVQDNVEFHNNTVRLNSHDGSNNYLRLGNITNDTFEYKLISEYGACRVIHSDGKIEAIDPSGGPMISVGNRIDCYTAYLVPKELKYDVYGQAWVIVQKPELDN